jgi:hypothetical protein
MRLMDRIAAGLQRDRLKPGADAIGIFAASSVECAAGRPGRRASYPSTRFVIKTIASPTSLPSALRIL